MEVLLQFPNLSPEKQQAILDGPGMAPPEGVVPNLADPENSNGLAIAVSVVSISLVTFAILCRAYSRLFFVKKVRLEDCLGLAAFVAYVGSAWAFYHQLQYGGFFVHQWDVRFRDLQKAIYSAVMLTITYAITMIFAKTAILLEWTIPALPKVLTDSWLGSRIKSCCRSWAQMFSDKTKPSKIADEQPIYEQHPMRSTKTNAYRVTDDQSQTQLTQMGAVGASVFSDSYNAVPIQEDGGIVRHVEFTACEDSATTTYGNVDTELSRQHPWM
ncbi:hypothetical protein F4809DRAFT_657787 [Biscogniauxia mediterranea]|nr:hypothetical protein F4809DRAFT_657787 [Biscogniauxia mediterranea]